MKRYSEVARTLTDGWGYAAAMSGVNISRNAYAIKHRAAHSASVDTRAVTVVRR
jgi:hypothetical protein